MNTEDLWFVYIIRSVTHRQQPYIGLTDDYPARLQRHNEGRSHHASKFRPWETEVVIGFREKAKAVAFERYLKSGSGFSFAKRHF